MKFKTKEYIKFENKYIGDLTELWYKTKDEELRSIILKARKYLEEFYVSMYM
jgi:hypothetical protein